MKKYIFRSIESKILKLKLGSLPMEVNCLIIQISVKILACSFKKQTNRKGMVNMVEWKKSNLVIDGYEIHYKYRKGIFEGAYKKEKINHGYYMMKLQASYSLL